jgi:hypothetical protein
MCAPSAAIDNNNSCFSVLGHPRYVWAVSSIHGEADRLVKIHDQIAGKIKPGDRIVYLGNYSGYGPYPVAAMDELLTFRRIILSMPGMMCSDIVYLRGAQEEMWQKLIQLQFSPDPSSILLWMLGHGMSSTLKDYGLSPHDGIIAAREGIMSLTRWTLEVRNALKLHPGHDIFGYHIHRAAYTNSSAPAPLLFVNSGLNPDKPLSEQGDNFWWAGKDFQSITKNYPPFRRIVRGYDPSHNGVCVNCVTASIDGGCGFGGKLVAARFESAGEIDDLIEA